MCESILKLQFLNKDPTETSYSFFFSFEMPTFVQSPAEAAIYRIFHHLAILQPCYKGVPPPSDMRDAAAAAAVGTTPVEMPGFDKCRSGARYSQKDDTAATTSV